MNQILELCREKNRAVIAHATAEITYKHYKTQIEEFKEENKEIHKQKKEAESRVANHICVYSYVSV